MTCKAGIDIGTNTILLLIAEVEQNRIQQIYHDCVQVVRLGEGVDKFHAFQPQAMQRAEACFREYAKILGVYKNIDCKAVATSGSRDAKNSRDFFSKIEKILGFPIEIISGEEEAKYSFYGALSDKDKPDNYAVIDIGGGSTEVVAKNTRGGLDRKSFDIGCVRMTERFVQNDPPKPQELCQIRDYVRGKIAEDKAFLQSIRSRQWLGVAGTVTYLSAVMMALPFFDTGKIHGSSIQANLLPHWIERFAQVSCRERIGIGSMDKGRADVIIAGAIILEEILALAEVETIEVSIRGLRYGLL